QSDTSGSWRVVQDHLTGSLVITTTAAKHAAVQALFASLEATEAGPVKPVRSYPIKNRRVSEVIGLLEKLLDAGGLENAEPANTPAPPRGGTGTRNVLRTAPAPSVPGPPRVSKASGERGSVTLAADEPASRILAFGEPRLLDELGHLIATLDVEQRQVLIETL